MGKGKSGPANNESKQPSHHPITGEEFFLPFGNFTGSCSEDGQGPLLGRGILRSQLIRSLVFGGQKLACLVTGRRGMGKTSFVRYCLHEYRQNAFERFRRSGGGKSVLDLFVVLFMITLISGIAVLLAHISSMFLSDNNNGFTWVLGLLIALCLGGALIFAATYAHRSHIRPGQHWSGRTIALADMVVAALYLGTYLTAHRHVPDLPLILSSAVFLLFLPFLVPLPSESRGIFSILFFFGSGAWFPFTALCAALWWIAPTEISGTMGDHASALKTAAGSVLDYLTGTTTDGASVASQFGTILRQSSVDAGKIRTAAFVTVTRTAAISAALMLPLVAVFTWQKLSARWTRSWTRLWRSIFIAGLVLAVAALGIYLIGAMGKNSAWIGKFGQTSDNNSWAPLALATLIIPSTIFTRYHLSKYRRTIQLTHFITRPHEITRAQISYRIKSTLFFCIGLQLIFLTGVAPIAQSGLQLSGIVATHLRLDMPPQNKDADATQSNSATPTQNKDAPAAQGATPPDHVGSFYGMTLSIAGMVMVLAALETIAISRVFGVFGAHQDLAASLSGHSRMNLRRRRPEQTTVSHHPHEQSTPPGKENERSPYLDNQIEHWCRRLEQMTLSYQIYKLYNQPIIVSVNLGFNDLRHSSVVHGMLMGLRDEYRRAFLEWNSHLASVLRLTGGTLLLVTVILISNSLFYLPEQAFTATALRCPSDKELSPTTGNTRNLGPAPALLCKLSPDGLWLNIMYFPVIPTLLKGNDEKNTFMQLLFAKPARQQTDEKNFSEAIKNVKGEILDHIKSNSTASYAILSNRIRSSSPSISPYLHETADKITNTEEFIKVALAEQSPQAPLSAVPPETQLVRELGKDILKEIDTERKNKLKPIEDNRTKIDELTKKDNLPKSSKNKKTSEKLKSINGIEAEIRKHESDLLIFDSAVVSAVQIGLQLKNFAPQQDYSSPGIRLYHVATFFVLLALARWINRGIPLLPYRRNLEQIDALLNALTSKTARQSSRSMWERAKWVHSLFSQQEQRTVETNPLDSRAVETAFIAILRDLTTPFWVLPGGRLMRLGLPTAEITFVFDEMDKLWDKSGVHRVPEPDYLANANGGGNGNGAENGKGEADEERRRAQMTSRLLSDLKRVISDSPARFIFVGGRLLHDEWLADMHSSSALLTSIFDSEMYLPSLLMDTTETHHKSGHKTAMHSLVGDYLRLRYQLALHYQRMRDQELNRFVPWFKRREENGMVFLGRPSPDPIPILRKGADPYRGAPGTPLPLSWQKRIGADLVHYLTYRSAGNPKRLQEMLGELIRPESRMRNTSRSASLLRPDSIRSGEIVCLNPPVILCVQFVAEIYRHLAAGLKDRLLYRDDKIALAAFRLTDYLFKFHRRAFGWHNLERIDELTHIHRAPDIREMLSEIVAHFGQRFLHQVVNGMYDFRFRAEVAQELNHISQYNESEMAAFNFTLDESVGLKTSYQQALAASDRPSQDIISGLAELCEYDQEYDSARQHYRRALRTADEDMLNLFGMDSGGGSQTAEGLLLRMLETKPGAQADYPRIPLSWALSRLRLMLQIGMTYEQSANFERAEGEYVAAHHLARKFLQYYIGFDYSQPAGASMLAPEGETLKHASLLYQPMFAIAWNTEKLWSDIDTSITTVEKTLDEILTLLPFVKDGRIPAPTPPHQAANSGFALIASDLHNKAGDLLYFKGRQIMPATEINDYTSRGRKAVDGGEAEKSTLKGAEGYLIRAHYHYCMALHELRRYIHHRKTTSRTKLNPLSGGWPTLAQDRFPYFVNQAAAGVVANLAEGILARVSVCSLLRGLANSSLSAPHPEGAPELWPTLKTWLGSANAEANDIDTPASACLSRGKLADWLGLWDENKPERLALDHPHHAEDRLVFALNLSMAGAELRAADGQFHEAGVELLMVVQSVCQYLWTLRQMRLAVSGDRALVDLSPPDQTHCQPVVTLLGGMAIRCLRRADSWFRMGGKGAESPEDYLPPEAVTQACSLALALPDGHELASQLLQLVTGWLPAHDLSRLHPSAREIRRILFNALLLQRYPVLNRLCGLKILIDSMVMDNVPVLETGNAEQDEVTVGRLMDEYYALFDRYNAPHLSPYSHLGQTAALYHLHVTANGYGYKEKWACGCQRGRLFDLQTIAVKFLRKSTEMYTLGAAYYQTIGKMYYLYDDFNDRKLHHVRALETAGWELSCILLHCLGNDH